MPKPHPRSSELESTRVGPGNQRFFKVPQLDLMCSQDRELPIRLLRKLGPEK